MKLLPSRRKALTISAILWIAGCVMLLGTGVWLYNAGEKVGANFLFVGVPIVSIFYVISIVKELRRKT